jgi:serine/threonine protein kinase
VLHDVGVEGDTPYLVMELLAGETLDARLTKGRLPLDDALALGAQIAQALDAAHRQGIAHRDLKPANVMLVKGARGTDAKLLDFGVARPVDVAPRTGGADDEVTRATAAMTAALTDRHTLVGTLPYMAPEQLAGQPADARTDLWALGCVLYEMLTGTRPFAGKTTASLMAAILEQPAPPLADRAPLTPPLVDHLVRRCLEKDPEQRWQSARDVALELDWARGRVRPLRAMAGRSSVQLRDPWRHRTHDAHLRPGAGSAQEGGAPHSCKRCLDRCPGAAAPPARHEPRRTLRRGAGRAPGVVVAGRASGGSPALARDLPAV